METEHIKIFTGSSILVKGLQNLLDDHKLSYLIKDRFESARLGGYGEHISSVELFVLNTDINEALRLVETYNAKINS